MSYKLNSLTVENLVVFRNRTTINFDKTSLNLIEAEYKQDSLQSNGAGKSLIIDAISLALFGRGVRLMYLQDYISVSNLTGGIYIGLELEDTNGDLLKIERWRRPNSDSTKAKLWLNNVCISKDSTIQKIDEQLGAFLGVTHSNFLSVIFSVMLPGFMSLRSSQRFEVLENALAVKRLDTTIKKINAALKITDETLSGVIEVLLDKSNLLGQEMAKKDLYLSNTKELEKSIQTQRAEYAQFANREQEILSKRNSYWSLLEDSRERIKKKEAVRSDLRAKLASSIETSNKVAAKLQTVSKALKQTENASIECIVCKSVISKTSEQNIKKHYEEEIANLKEDQNNLNSDLKSLSKEIGKLSSIETKVTETLMNLDSDLRFLQSSMLASEKIVSNTVKAIEETKKTYEGSKLALLEQETTELAGRKSMLTKEMKMIAGWKQALSKNGLRLSYIQEEVGTLSAIASTYASAVYNTPTEVKFFISEERDVPNLDFTVNGKNAAGFSTGERRLLEIAMTLSLMTLLKSAGLNLNFIVLDEATDGLSSTSKTNVLNLIDTLSESNQILVISHDPLMKQKPGNIILITKDSSTGLSTITISNR